MTDHLGSVLNAEVAGNTHAFSAWGERLDPAPISISASSPPVQYGFQGMQYDAERYIVQPPHIDGVVPSDVYVRRVGKKLQKHFAITAPYRE